MKRDETGFSKRFEEYAYVLDYLPHGKPSIAQTTYRAEPVVQVIGETYFTLLEAALKKDEDPIKLGERVYVGKGPRRYKISRVLGRIKYEDLTSTAKLELITAIEKAVKNQEVRFIRVFNTAQAVTPRMHSLELLPGVGKKYMRSILRQREIRQITSFEDLKERVGLHDPGKILARRIFEELTSPSKYRMFTRPP
jgi:putative nucleotide binding protein